MTDRKIYVLKGGQFVEKERPAPALLPPELRSLPGEYVTKDTGDPDKLHPLDTEFPHIVDSVVHEKQVAEREAQKEKAPRDDGLKRAPVGEVVPLRQDFIDVERWFAIKGIVKSQLTALQEGLITEPDITTIRHLWFPEDNVNNILLRVGRPPSDSQRPKHMRGFDIAVDLLSIPPSIVDEMWSRGIDIYGKLKELLQYHKIAQRGYITVVRS